MIHVITSLPIRADYATALRVRRFQPRAFLIGAGIGLLIAAITTALTLYAASFIK